MKTPEIQQSILESDDFVLSETKKIQYLYKLKTEMRYNQVREDALPCESVADHVYAMQIIANYFLPLEDSDNKLNRSDIFNMINWHDISEVETGDMLGQLKTAADRAREADAMNVVLTKLPDHLRDEVDRLVNGYETQSTPEAKFVKAVDKIEPIFEVFQEGYKEIFKNNQTTLKQHRDIKIPYIKNYPYMSRFYEVVTDHMVEQGFFVG